MTVTQSSPDDFPVRSLRPLVEAALSRARAELPIEVRLVGLLSDLPMQVHCNPPQLDAAIVDLCIMSWLALGAGEGRVVVALDDITLDEVVLDKHAGSLLGGLPPRRHARLCVSNCSLGFEGAVPVANAARRVPDVPEVGRSRLRLNAIRKIVSAHQGTFDFHGSREAGITYEIYLPAVVTAAFHPTTADAGARAGPVRRHRVLYVDDYESMRILLTDVLEDAGCDVTACARADEAIAVLRSAPEGFDLVVTDQNMPGLSGIELTQAVRTIYPDLPVAIITGLADDSLPARARAAKVNLLLSKSKDIESLCRELLQLLHAR